MTNTDRPCLLAVMAVASPPAPDPMTRTSQCLTRSSGIMSSSLTYHPLLLASVAGCASPLDATVQLLHNSAGCYRGRMDGQRSHRRHTPLLSLWRSRDGCRTGLPEYRGD